MIWIQKWWLYVHRQLTIVEIILQVAALLLELIWSNKYNL